ncbi:MAG: hypothetical protein JSS10_03495 [Verrucomicrobia bacterium]|nr:hypothetical protein [Verrucomicrobiota bacterium]
MSTVPSATAPSATSSSLWNNKNYFLLAGAGLSLVLFIAYRYFYRTPMDKRPSLDLTQRLLRAQFPLSANVNPKFPSEVSGIIRISLDNAGVPRNRNPLEFIFIEYTRQGKTFSLPMTVAGKEAEAYLRHLPYGEKVELRFKYENNQTAGLILKVDQPFGIYEIYIDKGNFKVDSHPETPPQKMNELSFPDCNADNPLALSINPSKLEPLRTNYSRPENHYYFVNTTHKVHVLFFEIVGQALVGNPLELRLVVPIAVFPGITVTFPRGFLRTCWEHTYRSTHGNEPPRNPKLWIMGILDTAAPDQS